MALWTNAILVQDTGRMQPEGTKKGAKATRATRFNCMIQYRSTLSSCPKPCFLVRPTLCPLHVDRLDTEMSTLSLQGPSQSGLSPTWSFGQPVYPRCIHGRDLRPASLRSTQNGSPWREFHFCLVTNRHLCIGATGSRGPCMSARSNLTLEIGHLCCTGLRSSIPHTFLR
jgi:hypothetical protein